MTILLLIRTMVRASTSTSDCFDQVMREQEVGGKIFFLDGTGAWGNPTPQNVAYGAAKRAITQVKVRRGAHTLCRAGMAPCVYTIHTDGTNCKMHQWTIYAWMKLRWGCIWVCTWLVCQLQMI